MKQVCVIVSSCAVLFPLFCYFFYFLWAVPWPDVPPFWAELPYFLIQPAHLLPIYSSLLWIKGQLKPRLFARLLSSLRWYSGALTSLVVREHFFCKYLLLLDLVLLFSLLVFPGFGWIKVFLQTREIPEVGLPADQNLHKCHPRKLTYLLSTASVIQKKCTYLYLPISKQYCLLLLIRIKLALVFWVLLFSLLLIFFYFDSLLFPPLIGTAFWHILQSIVLCWESDLLYLPFLHSKSSSEGVTLLSLSDMSVLVSLTCILRDMMSLNDTVLLWKKNCIVLVALWMYDTALMSTCLY